MTLVSLLRDPDRYERMRRGSQDFVRDHQWERTLQPLRELCRAPRIDATKETFSARPAVVEQPRSFLSRIRRRLAR